MSDGENTPMWREVRAAAKERRLAAKETALAKLSAYADVEVLEAFNNGEHLRVRNRQGVVVDYWPSTGRWRIGARGPVRTGGYEAIRVEAM